MIEPLCRQADADNGDRECRERQRHKSDQSDISDHDRIKTSSDAIGDMIHHWKESQVSKTTQLKFDFIDSNVDLAGSHCFDRRH